MSMITIHNNGRIFVGDTDTGYGVKQTAGGTEVYVAHESPRFWNLYVVYEGDARRVADYVVTDGINSVLVLAPSESRAILAAQKYDAEELSVDNIVWDGETIGAVTAPELPQIELPHHRYSLAHDAPASGVAGRAQFEADFLAATKVS